MNRKTVAIIIASKPNYNEYAAKYFLLSLNKFQKYYEFIFPEIHEYQFDKKYYSADELFDTYKNSIAPGISYENNPDFIVNIFTAKFEGNLFFECRKPVAFITTDTWEKYFSPPSLYEYLLHCIFASLLFMHDNSTLSSHHDTRGCYLDYTFYKPDDKVDITLGYICDSCQAKIISEIGRDYANEINNVINREWIGEVAKFGTVAYNLKKFFNVDLDKDSGFNKTFWEKTKEHLPTIPGQIIIAFFTAIIGTIITLTVAHFIK